MIRIIDVCKVLCADCGCYLEGVVAVFGNRAARLCWQDFQIRAMKRDDRPFGPCCLDGMDIGPSGVSTGCNCPYQRDVNICISDWATRSMSETRGGSRSEGRTESHGETRARHDCGCGSRRRGVCASTHTVGVSLSDQLASTRESLRRLKTRHAYVRVEEPGFIDGEGI